MGILNSLDHELEAIKGAKNYIYRTITIVIAVSYAFFKIYKNLSNKVKHLQDH